MTKLTYKKGIKVFKYKSKDFIFSREERLAKGKFSDFLNELDNIKNNTEKKQAKKG